MALVRRSGNQLLIVQEEKLPESEKVRERILFTLYSKAEAFELLGRREQSSMERFRFLLEAEYPEVKFNWKAIRNAIEQNIDALPNLYGYRQERLRNPFRRDLCAFTRRLILTSPQNFISAQELLHEHRRELEYVAGLIASRLKFPHQTKNEWNEDNPYYWRLSFQGGEVPLDIEEQAAGLFERGDYDRAEGIFRLLVECFDRYAEGYNYLGLIALEQDRFDAAIEYFTKTAEIGRKLFPARISKERYWSDLSTRPYMRGLRNLTLTLNQSGRFDEALAVCERLSKECDDEWTANWHRAVIYLNTRKWQSAADAARQSTETDRAAGFIAAFALLELGHREDALGVFLHAALNSPEAAQMLVNTRIPGLSSKSAEDEDYNTGVSLLRSLHTYLKERSGASKRFFRGIIRDARVVDLIGHRIAATRVWKEQDPAAAHKAFGQKQLMRSVGFAKLEARKLRDLAGLKVKGPRLLH